MPLGRGHLHPGGAVERLPRLRLMRAALAPAVLPILGILAGLFAPPWLILLRRGPGMSDRRSAAHLTGELHIGGRVGFVSKTAENLLFKVKGVVGDIDDKCVTGAVPAHSHLETLASSPVK